MIIHQALARSGAAPMFLGAWRAVTSWQRFRRREAHPSSRLLLVWRGARQACSERNPLLKREGAPAARAREGRVSAFSQAIHSAKPCPRATQSTRADADAHVSRLSIDSRLPDSRNDAGTSTVTPVVRLVTGSVGSLSASAAAASITSSGFDDKCELARARRNQALGG